MLCRKPPREHLGGLLYFPPRLRVEWGRFFDVDSLRALNRLRHVLGRCASFYDPEGVEEYSPGGQPWVPEKGKKKLTFCDLCRPSGAAQIWPWGAHPERNFWGGAAVP